MDRNNEQSKSTFISLDINEEIELEKDSKMISEPFSKTFEELKLQLTRMSADLNNLQNDTHKLTLNPEHNLRDEVNRKLIKMSKDIDRLGEDLRRLSSNTKTDGEKGRLKQLALEYSKLLDKIEETDKVVIKECKAFVKQAKSSLKRYEEEEEVPLEKRNENIPLIANSQSMINAGLREEIEYNERLIDEREIEIQNISRASNLINELFQQIGLIVSEQQDLIDNIEANADFTRETTRKAVRHLDRTHRQHQRKTSRMCFYLIFIIIVSVFAFSVLASLL